MTDEWDDDCVPSIVTSMRERGVDLSAHEASLAALLRDVSSDYREALEDWRDRADPYRPKRRLSDNWNSDRGESPSDYGADTAPLKDWAKHWKHFHARPPGNPGKNKERQDGPPVELLLGVHYLARAWWTKHDLKPRWQPSYPRRDRDSINDDQFDNKPYSHRSQREAGNASAMFFLLIAQEACDYKYMAENCYSLLDTLKNRKRSPESQAKRNKHRKDYARAKYLEKKSDR